MRGSKGMVGSGGHRKAWGMPPCATVGIRHRRGRAADPQWAINAEGVESGGRCSKDEYGGLNAKRPIKGPLCPLQLRGMHHLSAQVLRNRRLERIQLRANAGGQAQLSSRRRSSQRSSRLLMNELLDFDFPAFPFRALPNAAPLRVAK